MAVHVGRMLLGEIGTNCYYVFDEDLKEAIVFDPASHGEEINYELQKKGIHVIAILLTHGHYDHIMGVNELREASGAKVYAAEKEREFLLDADSNLSGRSFCPYTVSADSYLKDGEELSLGGMHLIAYETPGHTAGSMCYYFDDEHVLISGDTLFAGSVGRTDLPTGSNVALIRSIREKLTDLPEDTRVYPGHGEDTTIGEEKKYNPFL